MKQLTILGAITILLLFAACDKTGREKVAMNKAFRAYIAQNDSIKNYNTKIEHVEIVSYERLTYVDTVEHKDAYEARVRFVATTAYEGSKKIYNINDTVVSYFDKDLNMIHMVNTGVK